LSDFSFIFIKTMQMKRVLVIGASSGIGAEAAKALTEKGCSVIWHGRDKRRLMELTNGIAESNCSILIGDVVEWAENAKSIPEIEPVDAILWSAGICELAAGQMLGLGALRRTLAVNLEAPLIVSSYLYRRKIIKEGGTILFMGSSSAHDAGEGFSIYAASKGGIASAARILNKEFSRRKIRVKCLEPGTVNTAMTKKLLPFFGGREHLLTQGMVETEVVVKEILRELDIS
jgi:short-subunit dehydrogenase